MLNQPIIVDLSASFSCPAQLTVALGCHGFAPADWLTVPSAPPATPCVIDSSTAGDTAIAFANNCVGEPTSLSVTVKGVTFQNGVGTGFGGAISGTATLPASLNIDLVHCAFINNTAGRNSVGGAVAVRCDALEIPGRPGTPARLSLPRLPQFTSSGALRTLCTSFVGNTATSGGGAIFSGNIFSPPPGTALELDNSLFLSNAVGFAGGAVALAGGAGTIRDCSFVANTATVSGNTLAIAATVTSLASKFVGSSHSFNLSDTCSSADVALGVGIVLATSFTVVDQLIPLCPALNVIVSNQPYTNCTRVFQSSAYSCTALPIPVAHHASWLT